MPESWDAGEYRDRATAWLQKAESLTAQAALLMSGQLLV